MLFVTLMMITVMVVAVVVASKTFCYCTRVW